MRSKLALLALLAFFVGGYGVHSGWIIVPNDWNPWSPLGVDDPLNWLTRMKLARLSADDALCSSVLAQARMRYHPVPDRETGPDCGFRNAVRITQTSVDIGQSFTLSCRAAVALALWERHILLPAAQTHFAEPVARMEHLGSYSCRNIYGRDAAPRSRHSTADALDVSAFVFKTGRRITVERHWEGVNAEGQFLRDVRSGACRVFDSVLGPEYNAEHRTHFHLDRGGYRVCR